MSLITSNPRPAAVVSRIVARLLDSLLSWCVFIVGLGVISAIDSIYIRVPALITMVSFELWNRIHRVATSGQSIGKASLRLQVRKFPGEQPIGYGWAIVRYLTLMVLGPLSLLPLFGRDRRGVHDLISGSHVIKEADLTEINEAREHVVRQPGEAAPTAIELIGITKRFPGVIANDNINFSVEEGEIHAICGENGAGKSTLMKILYGMQPADEGVMKVNGEEVTFASPTDAIAAGIGMVHQHFMLADQLSVIENIILGSEPITDAGLLDVDTAKAHLAEVGESFGLTIDPDDFVSELEVGERQRVEIIKVLYRGANILILDEPTAVLVPQEVEALFDNLRELKAAGSTIIFIDHKLQEVLEISDRITIIRHGKSITTVNATDVTAGDLAELMVGEELPSPATTESTVTDTIALEVRSVTVLDEFARPVVDDVSFKIHEGEVLGIAGIEGNGQGELVDAIIGIENPELGAVLLGGDDLSKLTVRRRREQGIGYVPKDRHDEGLLLSAPLWENAALGHQTKPPYSKGPWIDRKGSRTRTDDIRERFDVRSPNADVAAHALSGGNQQKLIIGREVIGNPKVMILAHPTRGIDVGAQAAVWNEIRTARAAGQASMLISADLDELIGLSDRIMVMFHGKLVAELDPNEITPRLLGSYMTGAALDDGATDSANQKQGVK